MKNRKSFTLIAIPLSIFLISSVGAHPGRTDKNGGHWDREAGTYHFHTGEYAGKGGGGSSDIEYFPFTPPYEPPTDNPYKKDTETEASVDANKKDTNAETSPNTKKSIKDIVCNVLAIIFGAWYIIGVIINLFIMDFRENDGCFTFGILTVVGIELLGYLIAEHTKIFFGIILAGVIIAVLIWLILKLWEKFSAKCASEISNIDLYSNELYQLSEHYENLSQIKVYLKEHQNAFIPALYELDAAHLPKEKNSVKYWGETFTLYKTGKGAKLHARYSCCSATTPTHVYHYRNHNNFEKLLCKKCAENYVLPDMRWYDNYLKYEQTVAQKSNIENICIKLREKIKNLHKRCNSKRIKILIVFSKKNKFALQKANNKYKELI